MEQGEQPAAIASALSIGRRTVYDWLNKFGWRDERAKWLHDSAQVRTESARDANRQSATANVLTHVRRLELLKDIAEDRDLEARDRIAAIKLSVELDPPADGKGALDADEESGPPKRLVVVDPGDPRAGQPPEPDDDE